MKTLIIETIEQTRIAELVTVSKIFGDKPDIVAIGKEEIPGTYNKAYQTEETIAANLVPALADLIEKEGYEVILLSATTLGAGLAGPLAVRLSAPFLSEVTGVTSDLTVKCPLYGGKAVAEYKVTAKTFVLTIRRKYFEPAELEGTTRPVPLAVEDKVVSLIAEREEKTEGIPLEDAEVIITGGRGIGNAENFSLLQETADFLGGAVGASRGAVDEGFAPPTQQVGQTGKIVAPSVYMAVGVSGASQHLAGITNAKCVVGVNKDEEANIYKRARFGIVCDYKKFIPVLNKVLAEEK